MSMPEPATVTTRHTLTGAIQKVTPEQYALFPDYLEIVPEDAKPYEPGMFKPGKVGEFRPSEDAPATDAIADAQAAYDLVLADGHAPNSKLAREAKAALVAAEEAAQEQVEDAEKVVETQTDPGASPASPEGDAQ